MFSFDVVERQPSSIRSGSATCRPIGMSIPAGNRGQSRSCPGRRHTRAWSSRSVPIDSQVDLPMRIPRVRQPSCSRDRVTLGCAAFQGLSPVRPSGHRFQMNRSSRSSMLLRCLAPIRQGRQVLVIRSECHDEIRLADPRARSVIRTDTVPATYPRPSPPTAQYQKRGIIPVMQIRRKTTRSIDTKGCFAARRTLQSRLLNSSQRA